MMARIETWPSGDEKMNELLEKLRGGDLRSDGRANEAADDVLNEPALFRALADGLREPDDVVRGRAIHALEMVSRANPKLLEGLLPQLVKTALEDSVPMVRWHIAMIFPNLPLSERDTDLAVSTLLQLLDDKSAFVRSWAISSLAILGRRNKDRRWAILDKIKPLVEDRKIGVRPRAKAAVRILTNDDEPIPKHWMKAKS